MHFTLMPGSLHPSTGAQNAFLTSAGFITLLHSTQNRFFSFEKLKISPKHSY
jgi:hypothetical protein